MFKNASIIALAFAGSLTLWGCKSDNDKATDEWVAAMNKATKAYGDAKDNAGCKAATEGFVADTKTINEKYPDLKIAAGWNDNKEEVKEADKKMKEADVKCTKDHPPTVPATPATPPAGGENAEAAKKAQEQEAEKAREAAEKSKDDAAKKTKENEDLVDGSGNLETGVHHQQMGRKRSHGKHTHHVETDAAGHNKVHARMIADPDE